MEEIKFWAVVTCFLLVPTSVLAMKITIRSIKNHGTRLYVFGETEEQLRHKDTLSTIVDNTSKVIIRQLDIEHKLSDLKEEMKLIRVELDRIAVELKNVKHD